MFNIKEKQKGFTIVELVIALFILAFAIIGVYNAFSTIVVITTGASSRFTAAYLAQEGVEIVRNIRDNNWISPNGYYFKKDLDVCDTGCELDYKTNSLASDSLPPQPFGGRNLNIGANGFFSYNICNESTPGCSVTTFQRKIIITSDDANPDVMKVKVLVTWLVKDETLSIEVEENLYDWY